MSFSRVFQIDPTSVAGRSMFALGGGEWDVAQLRSLLKLVASGSDVDVYEMDLLRPHVGPRRLVISAHRLDYGDLRNVRVLLAVSDVTDARLAARLKDDLLREKAVLFQELQHRVANSLQIIASVLMQSARKIPSPEARSHLYDAHSRVMSVAALQQQLAASKLSDVALRAYFTDLCDSIGASMIHDRAKVTLKVAADDGVASADQSVSLGLIVTELVINALKHAFPDGRQGAILVSYQSQNSDWTLSVGDDGVGMPTGSTPAKAGLGSSIVEALARQLRTKVVVISNEPGTVVSIVYKQAASDGGPLQAQPL